MTLLRIIESLRARSATLLKAGIGVLVLLVVLDALPFVVDKADAHTAAERLPGFWAVYGLAGCFLLVYFAKTLGAAGIQKGEDSSDE
ncbi:MAG: hypothetical protein JJU00_17340 [Opitutales bacterium]|nr:hypothetical protein [Opitutales bacterium]